MAFGVFKGKKPKNPFRVPGKIIGGIKNKAEDVTDIPEEVFEKVPELVEKALEAAIKEAQKGVLSKAVHVLEAAAPDKVGLTIGPVGLNIGDVHDRLDTIKQWAKHPPSSKHDIRRMIETIGPSSVSINLSAELALVFVSSSSLSLGMSLSWETSAFLDRFEQIMGAL